MIRACILSLALASPAYAQSNCTIDPDKVTFSDAGEGRAVVTYYNSGAGCSGGMNKVMTTPRGIVARVIIDVNVDPQGGLERVTVIPETDGFFAFPPEAELQDGATVEIVVMGGMA